MAESDWTQPYLSESPESLWQAFHDASLIAFSSDRLEREIRLVLEPGFPNPPEPFSDYVTVVCRGVTHAQVFVYRSWPGPAPKVETPVTEAMKIEDEAYRRKSRAETIGLDVFQSNLSNNAFEVMNGSLHSTEGRLTLTLDGYADGDLLGDWWELRIGAESLDVVLPDGSPLGLSELLRIGASGWDAWSSGTKPENR